MNSINRRNTAMIALAAALICLVVYLPTLFCGFVNYDDPDYILNNSLIRTLDWNMLVAAFNQPHVGWWMPLTWVSLSIDYHFWGLNPLGYHLTNILLHAANTLLVVLLAARLTAKRRLPTEPGYHYWGMLLLAGLLFGIHPLRVESVAWVTERKDVLNGLFTLGSMLLYLRYVEKKEVKGGSAAASYVLSLLLFILSLMSKSVSVVLPALLLLADWYPLGRLHRGRLPALLLEKLPFVVPALVVSLITFRSTAQSGYLVSYEAFPFVQRLAVSGNAIFEYCRLLLWPVGILPYHMIPDPVPVSFAITTACVVLFGCWCIVTSGKRPWICATFLAFLLPLVPVLAFFQNGDQSFAARFTYLPSVVPSVAGAVLMIDACKKQSKSEGYFRYTVALLMVLTFVLYAGLSIRLIGVWKSPVSFWTRVVDVEPGVVGYKERAKIYHAAGKFDEAIRDYSEAIRIASGVFRTTSYNLYAFRGESYRSAGRYNEAVQDFTDAIALFPHPTYFYHRGLALQAMGQVNEAAEDFRNAGTDPGPIDWFDKGN